MARQAERREKARRSLLDAAAAVFGEKGYSESSLELVARRAGVSRALIYHHFGSKEGLLLAVHEELDRALMKRVQRAVGEGGTPLENLTRGARAFLQASAELPVARITLLDTPSVPGLRQHTEEGQREWSALIERELTGGLRQRLIAPIDPQMTARVVLGALQEASRTILAGSDPIDSSRRAQDAVTKLIEGLARK